MNLELGTLGECSGDNIARFASATTVRRRQHRLPGAVRLDRIPGMIETYMRFRVQLAKVEPPIWRRFLIRANATFLDLHDAIQDACGWAHAHPFAFEDSKRREIACGPLVEDASGVHEQDDNGADEALDLADEFQDDDGDGDDGPELDASKVALASWFSPRRTRPTFYEYDLGDRWLHEVSLEGLEQHDGQWLRRLLAGARAFPIEDIGGIRGYNMSVAIVTTGEDPEGMAMWIGEWHPEHFDLAKTKKRFDR
jgi:hypothetical protein